MTFTKNPAAIILAAAIVCAGAAGMPSAAGRAQAEKPVTIAHANTILEKDLAGLPHMTPALVKEVLAQRPFTSMAAFDTLLGKTLSADQRKELYGRVFVPVDLNTASDAEILTIPGSGPRLLREFKEYRPYKSMEQFHREMRKYWDEKEVSRLARYVTIKP